MIKKPHPHFFWTLVFALLPIAVVLAITAYFRQTKPVPSAAPLTDQATLTPSPTAATVAPVATATPSPTIAASPTPLALPDSAQQVVAGFYLAYTAKNRAALATYFTADTTAEDQSLHSRLFTGVDTNGDPGGPTLFSTSTASQSVSSFSFSKITPQGSNWLLALTEQRLSASGASAGSVNTLMLLVPQGATWRIDAYYHNGSAGKYDGFLIQ